ncbi:MAG: LamG-like jellyroll fold domain-containing protein [Phycisphaerales bacterium]
MFTNIVAIVCLIPSALNTLLIEDQGPSRGTVMVLGEEPNRSLSFDGHNDFVTVPACKAMSYPGTGGWTVELWVKPVAYPQSGEASIIGQESVGIAARDPWSFRIHPTYFEFRVDDANGASDSIVFDLTTGSWQHVACVYERLEFQG